jgi:hypothetical protein
MSNTGNKIRRITVGTDMNNQMSYTVGGKHTFFVDGEKTAREVRNIQETEDYFFIYLLGSNNEVQLWKRLPKNNMTTVEFVID